MFSHVMVGANNVEASKKFYDALLGSLGYGEGVYDDKGRVFWFTDTGIFAVTAPIDGQPATCGNGTTIGFACNSPEQVDAWHKAGVEAGGVPIEDPPGKREGPMNLYLAYLRDPSDNKLCALHRLGS